ncbi:MAG: S-methyl-5-thioribose-1-phosphate isomerase [Dehalococcoidales bacterium]|nr:S-methyl-5-thioribose-1-phosphate isomerase [Dehalococcoidales bacterium]
MFNLEPLAWRDNKLIIIDQTRLPLEEVYLEITTYHEVASAIRRLAVRGAPVIGIAAAYGIALGALEIQADSLTGFLAKMETVRKTLRDSRPTARNLFWAIERMKRVEENYTNIADIKQALIEEALAIHSEQRESDLSLSRLGASLINEGDTVLTHCNAGSLATAGCGTALGIIKQAYAAGKIIRVMATETRPLLQGARLTAFELKKCAIPFTLITDSMAGAFMRLGRIQAVITGADRIAANGDTANKIGTYSHAVLAGAHGIPFYIAAPTSTLDLSITDGEGIVIEERQADEVTAIQGVHIAPADICVANPAFDITPHQYITAIITEKGIVREPYMEGLRELKAS